MLIAELTMALRASVRLGSSVLEERTLYASETRLKVSSAILLPGFRSG